MVEGDFETAVDKDGVKERTRTIVGKGGHKQRVTERVQVKTEITRTLKRVAERKNLPKFGEAKVSNQNVTSISPQYIEIEHPDAQLQEQTTDNGLSGTLSSFIRMSEQRALEREHGLSHVPAEGESGEGPVGVDPKDPSRDANGKYIPPGARAGGGPGIAMGGSSEGAECTIRVSNLTKNVCEEDLRELFGRFGRIARCSLPRMEKKVDDPDNPGYTITIKEVRGFAYISFYVRNEAEAAMGALQGHGYDHLILRLEWANPQAPRPDGGGGGGREAPRFRSGYGEKLAQDSTLKVSYASNLTENR